MGQGGAAAAVASLLVILLRLTVGAGRGEGGGCAALLRHWPGQPLSQPVFYLPAVDNTALTKPSQKHQVAKFTVYPGRVA